MNNLFASLEPLACLAILNCCLALSQYVVLRAGIFSVGTAAFASVGAYACAILVLRHQVSPWLACIAGAFAGATLSVAIALALARLRGVFQAIATVAAVQINLSLVLYYKDWTGGPIGLNGIPRIVGLPELCIVLVVIVAMLARIGHGRTGAVFDAIKQDETVAVSMGIRVSRYHLLAFVLSGFIAGLTGALMASYNHVVVPEEFGFNMLVAVLTFVVLGGSKSVLGPIVGAMVLTALPEIARPVADNRLIVHGALLMLVIIYMPQGIVDSTKAYVRQSRGRKRRPRVGTAGGSNANTAA